MSRLSHLEIHMVHRIGWLRAAVLGANDGLVSTSSLVVGVAAAGSGKSEVLIAGLAGLVAGAMSMAAGEYVSVSSQTDAERADLARETRELQEAPEAELEELTRNYVDRGLDRDLAEKVAIQLTERDALGSHARDELGISETVSARPIQAALVSALIVGAHDAGPLIRSKNGLWLAIPTPAAGKALGGRRITPGAWERKTGLRLRFVYRRTGPSLLVADGARINTRGLAAASRSKTGRGQVTAPIFLLVPQVKLPKRLDLARDAEGAHDAVPGLIVANWAEGKL
jgi:hypothetical protein